MTPKKVLGLVAKEFGITVKELIQPDNTRGAVVPRHQAAWLLVRMLKLSYPSAGKLLQRHHKTVWHSVKKVDKTIEDEERRIRIARAIYDSDLDASIEAKIAKSRRSK